MDGARVGFDDDPLGGAVGEYVAQGSGSGVSVAEATTAWRDWRLVPRLFAETTTVDLGCTLLGRQHARAFGVAPTTLQRAIHPDGELAVARACAATGTPLVVSSNAATPFADIGATGADWWLQVYVPQDRSLARGLLARAVEAGARAVVLTADTPVVSTRLLGPSGSVWDVVTPSSVRVNFDPGYDDDAPGAAKATDLGPADVTWLGAVTGLPVVVKGVLDPAGARRCADAGAGAVWVSIHGGRQLDRVVPTAHALPDVVAAVADDVEVYVDGGVRDGIDLLVAWALGARCVFLGRPVSWALRDGRDGVRAWVDQLSRQAVEALRLAGCASPGDAAELAIRPAGAACVAGHRGTI